MNDKKHALECFDNAVKAFQQGGQEESTSIDFGNCLVEAGIMKNSVEDLSQGTFILTQLQPYAP